MAWLPASPRAPAGKMYMHGWWAGQQVVASSQVNGQRSRPEACTVRTAALDGRSHSSKSNARATVAVSPAFLAATYVRRQWNYDLDQKIPLWDDRSARTVTHAAAQACNSAFLVLHNPAQRSVKTPAGSCRLVTQVLCGRPAGAPACIPTSERPAQAKHFLRFIFFCDQGLSIQTQRLGVARWRRRGR
jgi:hypothetical protein